MWNGEESVEFGEWRVEFCTAVNLSEPPAADDLPLTGLAFERRQWRKQRERQAAAVRKCKAYAAARAANGKGAGWQTRSG